MWFKSYFVLSVPWCSSTISSVTRFSIRLPSTVGSFWSLPAGDLCVTSFLKDWVTDGVLAWRSFKKRARKAFQKSCLKKVYNKGSIAELRYRTIVNVCATCFMAGWDAVLIHPTLLKEYIKDIVNTGSQQMAKVTAIGNRIIRHFFSLVDFFEVRESLLCKDFQIALNMTQYA